jgi:hypothetical protein
MSAAPTGTVFSFALADGTLAYGQVLDAHQGELLLGFFDHRSPAGAPEAAALVAQRPLAFVGPSTPSAFDKGRWQALGPAPLALPAGDYPKYKVVKGQASNVFVEDFAGRQRRQISGAELGLLLERRVLPPESYEKCLNAFYALGEWKEHYETLRIEGVLRSSKLWV